MNREHSPVGKNLLHYLLVWLQPIYVAGQPFSPIIFVGIATAAPGKA